MSDQSDPDSPFIIREASGEAVPLVVSIPHTGVRVPEGVSRFFAQPKMHALPNTDWHLHELYDFLPELGVTTIHAVFSRFVVDLNRPPENKPLYPGRFETGLVPNHTFHGEDIWTHPPDAEEIERRRQLYHAPYHAKLQALLESTRERFGRAVLIDAHSIMSAPTQINDELLNDIYLGDQEGRTCGEWLVGGLQSGFEAAGLRVVRNYPFKGGYITRHYGAMEQVEACQIEMAQRVYMNEEDPENGPQHERFDQTRQILRAVVERLIQSMD
ncbi:N-formylglutamate amidohydrolase [Natronospira proteinivora]|uniref:N-formylglutamate amidohydrolase n=1 Tax=Natronospira proteinivora TaxID=1807133 RepID=A0ABT1G780_9GAMM|nr:N-formylglutamate amidohydrolase [Natronospira proteinivora]MCP1727154.1 N-formylglutamate amidohydrolase [Natronospira proteinivora]